MSIGLCCQYVEPVTKRNGTIEYNNLMDERNLQYGRYQKGLYSKSDINKVWHNNVSNLLFMIKRINSEGFNSFRISSNVFPLHDSETELLRTNETVKSTLEQIGQFILESNMRLTCHPDQFVVLSSSNPNVVKKSIEILNHHAWVFDTMGLPKTPYYAINLHGGAKGNDQILISTINQLSPSARGRLTLENDERGYSVNQLFDVFKSTGIPIVLDTHHHSFNSDGLDIEKTFELSASSWGTIKPLTHLSNTTPGFESGTFMEKRKHSDLVHYIPKIQQELNDNGSIDIDFEFKLKNIAIKKAVKDFGIIL